MTTREIEFDPEKAKLNWQEHKVDFEDASLVFIDPMRIERQDDSESNTSNEERWQTLGMVKKVLFVVYTERGEKTRIISARTANKTERRSYHGHDHDNRKGWTKAD
ncbi:MAG: BrnT family toxin [Treponema sp.]|nr:BrnT family toxin [Treponema sp.]